MNLNQHEADTTYPYDGTNGYPFEMQINSAYFMVSDFTGSEDMIMVYSHFGDLEKSNRFNVPNIEIYESYIGEELCNYDYEILRKFDPSGFFFANLALKNAI